MAEEELNEKRDDNSGSATPVIAVLGVVFLLGVALGGLYYLMLRTWRQRPSVIYSTMAGVTLLTFAVAMLMDPVGSFTGAISSPGDLGENWPKLMPLYAMVNMVIADILGFALVNNAVKAMERSPHLLSTKGSWMYEFKYRRTPKEKRQHKQIVERLRNGSYGDETRSPLGIDESDDRPYMPAFRYASEARRHTFIIGGSGSGKALHRDTTLPTPTGKTTVGEAREGDLLLDEKGNPTKILAKYQPMTEDHYEITFSDGTKVRACGDHLWNVGVLNRKAPSPRVNHPLLTTRQENSMREDLRSGVYGDYDTITYEEMLNKYGVSTSFPLRSIATGTPRASTMGDDTLYDAESLAKALRAYSGDRITPGERNALLGAIESVQGESISRGALLSSTESSETATLLTTLGRSVEKVRSKTHRYNARSLLERVLRDQERRQNTLLAREAAPREITETISTREIAGSHRRIGGARAGACNYYVSTVENAVEHGERELPLHPYVLGAWLGDGYSRNGVICGVDKEIRQRIESLGYPLERDTIDDRKNSSTPLHLWRFSGVKESLRGMSLLQRSTEEGSLKDIPEEYLYGSIQQRRDLLSGLLDTDGAISKDGCIEVNMTNRAIVEKMRQVACSLGYNPTAIKIRKNHYRDADGNRVRCKDSHRFSFYSDVQLFTVPRKARRLEERLGKTRSQESRKTRRYIVDVQPVEDAPEDYYCFTVDSPSHLFLCTDSFVPTHNTISMLGLMRSDIEAGVPVFSIDMKGTPTFAAKLATWAKENNREFYHFVHGKPSQYRIPNSPGQAFYDPLGSGSPSAKADMLLNLRAWDDAASVYKEDMKQLLSVLFNALDQADPSKAPKIDWNHGGIYTVYSVLQGNNLDHLAAACEGKPVEEAIIALAEGYEDAQKRGRTNQGVPNAINNLRGQMNTIINSDYGRWMKAEPGGRNINLAQVAKKRNAVVLFSLDSDNAEEFSKYVGSMIMADLTRLSSSLRDEQEKKQIAIYADEFQTLNMETVKGLLEKGRESGMAVTLAQQSLEQVVVASARNGEAMLNSIMDVCSNFLVHAGSTFDSAERLSKLIGKEEYVDYGTTSDSDDSSLFGKKSKKKPNVTLHGQKKERWKFSPEQFMSLSIPDESNNYYATAVLVNKKSADPYFSGIRGGLARELWMIPAQEVLTDYYAMGDRTPVKARGDISGESGNIALSKGDSVESHAPIPLEDAPIQRRPVKKATIAQGLEREKALPSTGATVVDDGYEPTPDEYYEESYPEDEDDGNFKWEDVEDTDAQEEEEIIPTMNFSSISNLGTAIKEEKDGNTATSVAPTPSATPSPEAPRSSMKESKFTQQMRAKEEAEKRARAEAARAKAVKPSTGSTAASEKKVEDDLDDIALPPLDEIF